MTCGEGVALLTEYLEGVLPARARRSVEGHLAGCVRCRRFVVSYAATPRVFRVATEEAMPDAMRRRLRQRLARAPKLG